jgi:UDP-N-acetylglucosamine 2-epimerase (non-hydrolysing)
VTSPELRALVVFGTRPEAIKLAPVIAELGRTGCRAIVCATAQHRAMLDQVLELFDIACDHDLDLMRADQTLPDLTGAVVASVARVIDRERPDVVIVQGDTTTTMGAALAAFYARVPVAHVEAGLRSDDMQAPWPEEMNRRVVSMLASVHLAPTARARDRLLAERVDAAAIAVTGNTVVDALMQTSDRLNRDGALRQRLDGEFALDPDRPLILVTSHRRESFGRGLEHICMAVRGVADRRDVQVVYPVHMNPNVSAPVQRLLGGHARIRLVPPVDYLRFVYLLQRCAIVLTDSGGVQEEAPSLGRPVLVARETTERPEGIDAGVARLVGTDATTIAAAVDHLLDDAGEYRRMARSTNPYGDGRAAPRVVEFLRRWHRARRETAAAPAASGVK